MTNQKRFISIIFVFAFIVQAVMPSAFFPSVQMRSAAAEIQEEMPEQPDTVAEFVYAAPASLMEDIIPEPAEDMNILSNGQIIYGDLNGVIGIESVCASSGYATN